MKAWCMFEQSGTFKNEFKRLGIDAVDIDILNDFGETDIELDLFGEIEKAYDRSDKTIFDEIPKDDLVFAFFPCTRFEENNYMNIKGNSYSHAKWDYRKKLEYSRKLFSEVNHSYQLVTKLFLIAIDRGFGLIVENPRSSQHILTEFFPITASIVHMDRSLYGDRFKKPTQYWFINFSPRNNFIFENLQIADSELLTIENTHNKVKRSLITPTYANRFIREYILEDKE